MSNLKTCLSTGFLGCLFLSFTLNCFASDSERITQLEKDVLDLKQRLTKLESPQSSTSQQHRTIVSSEGWKSLSNWRSLKNGMSYDEVRSIIGEPTRIDGGTLARWHYSNGAFVGFFRDKVQQWEEPR
jgi:hypothetical protein